MSAPAELWIRPGTRDDLDALVNLERTTRNAPHWAAQEYAAIVVQQESGSGGELRRSLAVAFQGVELVGFAVGSVVGSGLEAEGELESIAVSEAKQRFGVGSALCEWLFGWFVEQGASQINLEVRAGSAAAIHLYERFGFVPTGVRPRYYQHPVEDAVLMRCDLRHGAQQAFPGKGRG